MKRNHNGFNGAKILLIDIETAPIIAYVWQLSLYKTTIRNEQIIRDTHLLSFAAKWLGDKNMIQEDQSAALDITDDSKLLHSIRQLLDTADIVVVQNGVAFDIPFIQARMAAAGIPPPSPFRVVDTCTEARKHFKFTSNKLDFLAVALKCKVKKSLHSKYPGIELWKECLAGNTRAWHEMREYNIDDVTVLEEVYFKIRPWIERHPNVGNYINLEKPVCPRCGGGVTRRGHAFTNFGKYQRYQCVKCHGWSRGRDLLNTRGGRKQQLSN